MLGHNIHNADDGNGEQQTPQTPHSHAQKSNAIKTAAAFIFAILPLIQVMTNMPTKVAIPNELPDTNSAHWPAEPAGILGGSGFTSAAGFTARTFIA